MKMFSVLTEVLHMLQELTNYIFSCLSDHSLSLSYRLRMDILNLTCSLWFSSAPSTCTTVTFAPIGASFVKSAIQMTSSSPFSLTARPGNPMSRPLSEHVCFSPVMWIQSLSLSLRCGVCKTVYHSSCKAQCPVCPRCVRIQKYMDRDLDD